MFNTKPTKDASKLAWALRKLGVKPRLEFNDGHKHIDIAIPSARLDIEVDGSQHYTNSNQMISDIKRTHYSDRKGYDTLHIPNVQIRENKNLWSTARGIARVVRQQRSRFSKFKKDPN